MLKSKCEIKPGQIRAGRALLEWSQEKLADAAGISAVTIRKIELGHIFPRPTTAKAIKQVFEAAGLEFIEPDGVRRRPEDVMVYEGPDEIRSLINDIRKTAKKKGGEILTVDVSEKDYDFNGFEFILDANRTVKIRCLLSETPSTHVKPCFEFRIIPRSYDDIIPFCVYGDKYAIIVRATAASDVKAVVVQSAVLAQIARRRFDAIWNRAG